MIAPQNTAAAKIRNEYFNYFSVHQDLVHISFCDDFGPLNLGCVFKFCVILDERIKESHVKPLVLTYPLDQRSLTNSVFLLGSYLIMKLDYPPYQVEETFSSLSPFLASFRDVSPGPQNFDLRLRDCWEGVSRAKALGWVSFCEGDFSLDDYEHCDSPLNADLHEVVPGRFIAMRGPRALPAGAAFSDTAGGVRHFSPAHYAAILRQYNVAAVVRLNAAAYPDADFESRGIAVVGLPFLDGTPPTLAVVAQFLAVAERCPGALAVHCTAGLGRTGTLIALYMMKHHGFTARAAMGWLRIVRPGSVIGGQQQFLCDREADMHAAGRRLRERDPAAAAAAAGPAPLGCAWGVPRVRAHLAAAADGVARRIRALSGSASSRPFPVGAAAAAAAESDAAAEAAAGNGGGSRIATSPHDNRPAPA